jgi:hypothetical protein
VVAVAAVLAVALLRREPAGAEDASDGWPRRVAVERAV